MDMFYGIETGATLFLALLIGFFAGVIKGVVGFAMPMVTISGLATIASAEVAIAGMILPTVATNLWQAMRQGPRAAWASVRRFRVFLITCAVVMVLAAQAVPWMPGQLLLLLLGVSITGFVLLQIFGIQMRLPKGSAGRAEPVFGAIAGISGGLSGIWGPPTVAMLTAMNTEKAEQIRVQGVIYGLGSLVLVAAHLGSGMLRAETLPLTAALVPPALLGMALGFRLQDRFDQATFRKVTFVVLLFGGLNLIRRGLV